MGITGLMLAGFVFVHMAGNLLIIFGQQGAFNRYGHGITSNPAYVLISPALLLIFIVHIVTAILLTRENRAARRVGYQAGPTNGDKAATLASRTMMYSGSILAVFLVSHLITFKYGAIYTTSIEGHEVRDLARLMYEVFTQPLYVVWYVFSLVFIGIHLKHGLAATFSSLGFWHPRYTPIIKVASVVYALVVSLGFIAEPLYIFFRSAQ